MCLTPSLLALTRAHMRSHLPRAGHTSIEEHGTKHGRVIISRYNRKVKKCISPITNNSRELTASRRLKYSSQKRTLCERVHSDGNRYCVVRYIEDLHGVAMDSQRPMSTSDIFVFIHLTRAPSRRVLWPTVKQHDVFITARTYPPQT